MRWTQTRCHCVNLFDELVAALDMVVSASECGGAIAVDEPATLAAARKVLEKVRKRDG